jgi:hypothetical protein
MARAAEVCARLLNRDSLAEIKRRTGVGNSTMKQAIETLRLHGVNVELRARTPLTEARSAEMTRLFSETNLSNRNIAARLGAPLERVREVRLRYNEAVVLAGGELAACGCGQYLHHPRLCWARTHENMKAHGVRSVLTLPNDQQADVRDRLLKGETMRSIGERVGLPRSLIYSFLASFAAEERTVRTDAFKVGAGRRRAVAITRQTARPQATRPEADPLYARIAAAVPRSIDPAIRDDIIGDAYIAILDGRAKVGQLTEVVKRARSKVFAAFANSFGPRSLDQVVAGTDDFTLMDTLRDESSSSWLEEMGATVW